MTKTLLRFSDGKNNAKLFHATDKVLYTFNLPSGWSCPSALECLSKTDPKTGRLTDGAKNKFRCYSASQECVFPNTRKQRWHNFNLLKGKNCFEITKLIEKSLPPKAEIIRIHASGDFFSPDYFQAWVNIARANKDMLFYAYTKSLNYWVDRLEDIPENLKLNASKGGRHDNLIDKHNLKYVEVVFSEAEAKKKGLKLDHNDTMAFKQNKSFALLLHGVQPAGSVASQALKKLGGISGAGAYSREAMKKA